MKKIIVFGLIFISVFIVGCSKTGNDAIKFKKEYESLNGKKSRYGNTMRSIKIDKKNNIKYKSASDIVEMMEEKKTFAVYFGFSKCPWCRSVVPTLLDVSKDLELENIYYVDILNIRDEIVVKDENAIQIKKKGSKSYYKLLSLLDNVLEEYTIEDKNGKKVDTLEKRIYAPNVISIVSGKAVKLETGISDKQTNPYMKLTDDMKKEMYHKFNCSLKCVVENQTTCSKNSAC